MTKQPSKRDFDRVRKHVAMEEESMRMGEIASALEGANDTWMMSRMDVHVTKERWRTVER